MRSILVLLAGALITLSIGVANADEFSDTTTLFKNAGQSASFFKKSYGYAVYPNIGKGGLGIGGAHGKGKVYAQGKYVGDSTVSELSVGLQAGGQAYSQIVFFEDKRAFDEFTKGDFEFGAGVGAVAITASAGVEANTAGSSAGAAGGKNDASTVGKYNKGMAVFTIVKGGAMYEATLAGQKYKYKAAK